MTRNFIDSIAIIALTVFAVSVSAQETTCAFDAWVSQKDPNGLNVRSEPDLKSKIVGKLKYDDGDDNEIVTVEVVGYRNGWVKISGASTVGGDTLFEGEGWITAKAVNLRTERPDGSSAKGVALYSRPLKSSRVAARISDEVTVRIVGFSCFGPQVRYAGKTGWLSREESCGNPVTTCP